MKQCQKGCSKANQRDDHAAIVSGRKRAPVCHEAGFDWSLIVCCFGRNAVHVGPRALVSQIIAAVVIIVIGAKWDIAAAKVAIYASHGFDAFRNQRVVHDCENVNLASVGHRVSNAERSNVVDVACQVGIDDQLHGCRGLRGGSDNGGRQESLHAEKILEL